MPTAFWKIGNNLRRKATKPPKKLNFKKKEEDNSNAPPVQKKKDQIQAFTRFKIDSSSGLPKRIKLGYPWSSNHLRLKSSFDLKRLWVLMIKERNAVLSDQYMLLQKGQSSHMVDRALQKVTTSMARLKTISDERELLMNNMFNLMEFFHYKKDQYTTIFKRKFPNKAGIDNPMFSYKEREEMKDKLSEIDAMKRVWKVDDVYQSTKDFVRMRDTLPDDFEIYDTFCLKKFYDNYSLKSLLEEFNVKKAKYKELSLGATNALSPNKEIEEVETTDSIRKEMYQLSKRYLNLATKILDSNYTKLLKSSKIKENEVNKNLLKKNREFVLRDITTEKYYVAILKGRESDYIEINFQSKFIDQDLKRLLIFPVTEANLKASTIGLLEGPESHIAPKPVSVLTEQEIKAVENLKQKTSAMSLLPMYVKNTDQLKAKAKRQLLFEIQKGRAKLAKGIFLKEMAAVAYKVKNMDKQAYNKTQEIKHQERKARRAEIEKQKAEVAMKDIKEQVNTNI